MVVFFNDVEESVSDETTYITVPLFSEGQLKITTYFEVKISGADLVSVGLIEDRPAEDDHVEDDDEAVKYGEGGHLPVSLNMHLRQ